MKKYIKPIFVVEVFKPNRAVSVCGYKFSCDAGVDAGHPEGIPGELWEVKKTRDIGTPFSKKKYRCMTGARDKPGDDWFQACGIVHYIPIEENPVFTWGYLTLGEGRKTNTKNPIPVRIWSYPDPEDPGWLEIHATTLLEDPPLSNHS